MLNRKDWIMIRKMREKGCYLREIAAQVGCSERTVRFSFWASAFYQAQREKGKTHQMAIRALAFKWIRILWRCWQDGKPYDEAKYLMALKDKGSPLVKELTS